MAFFTIMYTFYFGDDWHLMYRQGEDPPWRHYCPSRPVQEAFDWLVEQATKVSYDQHTFTVYSDVWSIREHTLHIFDTPLAVEYRLRFPHVSTRSKDQ